MFLKILFSLIYFIFIFIKNLSANYLTVEELEDYILNNPEIIIKSLNDFEKKKEVEIIQSVTE